MSWPHLPNLDLIGEFKLTKVSGHIGEVIPLNQCLQESMELHGEQKKNSMII